MVDVGEVEHLHNLVLSHSIRSKYKDLDKVETDGEKIAQVREREGSEIEEGDAIEARSTEEENINDAAKDAEEDENGADDSIGDALDQPLVVKAGRLEEGFRARLAHHPALPPPETGTNGVLCVYSPGLSLGIVCWAVKRGNRAM